MSVIDSPKKRTNEFVFVFFALKSRKAKKTNKFVHSFFGRIYSAPICFWYYLTFRDHPFKKSANFRDPSPSRRQFFTSTRQQIWQILTTHSPLKNANFDGPLSKVINYWSIYLKITTLWEGHKILKDLPLGFTRQLFLPNSVKTNGRFFQIFVAISGKLNFKIVRICTCVIRPVCDSFKPWFFIQSGLFKERIQFYLIK